MGSLSQRWNQTPITGSEQGYEYGLLIARELLVGAA